MRQGDYDAFAKLLDDAYDMISCGTKVLSADARAMFFRAVAKYPLEVFRAALHAHIMGKDGKFVPQPAHINEQIALMAEGDGRPGAEEAWAIALTGRDEESTVVWTAETAAALFICRPVLDSSGAISARKSFLEAYTRLVAEARAAHQPAQWVASIGWDKRQHATAIKGAVNAGRLPAPAAAALLDGPAGDPTPDAEARAQLARVKQMIKDGAEERERKRLAEVERIRLADEEYKRVTNDQVKKRLAEKELEGTQ